MKRLLTCFCIMMSLVASINAQTPIIKPDLSIPTLVAPAYFGPNAFPVPDMSDGSTSDHLKIGLYGDGFLCTLTSDYKDDLTFDLFAKATIPLFSDRINLTLWMPVFEYFKSGPEVNRLRRIENPEQWISGTDSGDAYVSTDILILDERRCGYGLVLRAALKSASGNSFSTARVYDCPGYFFDVAVGRNIYKSSDKKTILRVALSSGFLCWQTANGRQNDAIMYGLLTSLSSGRFKAELNYGGYVGWEGAGDKPMTLKTKLSWRIGQFSIDAMHQVGFMDWPFHQLRIGTTWSYPILKTK